MQDLDILNNSYLIIGGPNNKKSEVSRILSKRLNIKLINLDREKHAYFNDFTDYDFKIYQEKEEKTGKSKALNYIHKYEMKHLKHILNNLKDIVVIDFGSTYTLIDEEELLNKLKLFKNIILLKKDDINMNDFDRKLSNNKINKLLATTVINVDNKTVDNIVDEIINYKEFKDIL